jgi:glycosyltransferase involved in cell wall biosynthesis
MSSKLETYSQESGDVRLLFVINGSALNRGMNTGIENLAWGLAEHGFDIHILCNGLRPASHGYSIPPNVTYHFTDRDRGREIIIERFRQLAKDIKFDIVIGRIKNLVGIIGLAYTKMKRPVFIAHQISMARTKSTIYKTPLRRVKIALRRMIQGNISFTNALLYIMCPDSYYKKIDHVVSVSNAVRESVRTFYGLNCESSVVIPRGVDTTMFTERKGCYGLSESRPRILFTGRIIETKGVGDVVESFRFLQRPVDFVLCGNVDEKYKELLIEQLKSYGNEHSLQFMGALQKQSLIEQYKTADIFVLCSFGDEGAPDGHEGSPKSLLEAMACGLPVIVSDIAPFGEVVTDHKSGLVVPVRSPRRIAEAIVEYLENPELRLRCGKNARKTVEERFRQEAQINAWIKIIDELSLSKQ